MQPQTTAINTDNYTEIFTSMEVAITQWHTGGGGGGSNPPEKNSWVCHCHYTNTHKRVMQVTQNQI